MRADPLGVPVVVEEILRHRSPASPPADDTGLPRYAMADIDIDGVHVPAGDLVLVGLQQANLDPGLFPEPASFVPRESNPHLTFGHGFRFCVGAPLARIELMFHALVTRFETFGLAVGVPELRQRTGQLVGGVAELPVRWTVT